MQESYSVTLSHGEEAGGELLIQLNKSVYHFKISVENSGLANNGCVVCACTS